MELYEIWMFISLSNDSVHKELMCLSSSMFHEICFELPWATRCTCMELSRAVMFSLCLNSWYEFMRDKNRGHAWYSVSPIYRGRVYRGIGYIAVACWTPFFWRPRPRYFSRNRDNTLDPIRGRQFFAKSAHRDSLCSRFAGDNFSRNQLWPTCQCGLEHMLCDGQPSSAKHWHLHCIAE